MKILKQIQNAAIVFCLMCLSSHAFAFQEAKQNETPVGPTPAQDSLEASITPVVPSKKSKSAKKKKKQPTLLENVLKQSIEKAQFQPPTQDQLRAFETRLIATLALKDDWQQSEPEWEAAGWQLHFDKDSGYLVIAEADQQRSGRGVYAFRIQSKTKLVLQAPHRFFDRRTGTIVADLFQQHDVRAAAWNTVHRKQVDVAHSSRHFINAFTRAMIAHDSTTTTVQLHGFANDKKTGASKLADAIVSDATRFPGRQARIVTMELKESFGREAIRLYPLEVRELGGTKNAQAKLLRSLGTSRFLHVEMNADFR